MLMRQHLERDELRYAIWLNPDALCVEFTQPIMDSLRLRLNGPGFSPHLTLTSGLVGSEGQLIDIFRACAEQQAPFVLKPQGIGVSGNFFRAITVDCDCPEELKRFRQSTRSAFDLPPNTSFQPHLSLAYGEVADTDLASIQTELQAYAWPLIKVTSISLWRLKGPVENWRLTAHAALVG